MPHSIVADQLDAREALRLVAGSCYGRVVATLHALPHVWPVRYRVVGEHIVFPAPDGLQLHSRVGPLVLGFAVDNGTAEVEAQWSVMLVGEVTPAPAIDAAQLPQEHDLATATMALHPDVVIGRRRTQVNAPVAPQRGPAEAPGRSRRD